MKPAPPVMSKVANSSLLYRCAFRILQREPELFRQRVDGGAAPFPGAVGLEPEIADAASPRRDDAADGAEVAAVGVFLIEPAYDVRGDADEGSQRRRRANRVLASVPGAAEHERDLLEVVDEELFRLFVHVALLARERVGRKELLQLLREGRLRDASSPYAQQLDFVVKRRVFAVVERAHDVV